jgi:hypothetical protein
MITFYNYLHSIKFLSDLTFSSVIIKKNIITCLLLLIYEFLGPGLRELSDFSVDSFGKNSFDI